MNFSRKFIVLTITQFINSTYKISQLEFANKVVFIDPQVEDYQHLVSGVTPDAIVVILDATQDGIKQITQSLERHHLSEIHIVSHGTPGCLSLGSSQLNLDTLEQYQREIGTWSADSILLYGCHVAAGDTGAEFIQKLHQLTGAEIAASTTRIGHAARGGTWKLDVKTSKFEPIVAFNSQIKTQWNHVLDPFDSQPYFYQVISGVLKVFNPLTGDYDQIGTDQGNYNATGYNIQDNYIYGVLSGEVIRVNSDGSTENLGYTVTGNASLNSGTVDQNNNLWVRTDNLELTKINLADGTQTTVSLTGNSLERVVDIVHISSGGQDFFYGLDQDANLRIIDITNQTITTVDVAGLPAGEDFGAGWVDKDGTLYFSRNNQAQLFRIDNYNTASPSAVQVANSAETSLNDGMSDPTQKSTFEVPFIDPGGDNSGQAAFQYEDTFTEGGSPVGIVEPDAVDETTDTLLSDFDGDDSPSASESTIKSATITLTNAKTGDEFQIGGLPDTITSDVDTSTSGEIVITLSATDTNGATPNDFELALEAIQFENTSDNPDTTPRVIEIVLTDTEDNQGNTAKTYINVVPENDDPVATDNSNSIDEGATTAVDGNVITDNDNSNGVDSDPDGDDLTVSKVGTTDVSTNTEITGTYGTLTINDDGSYEYSVDNTNSDVQALSGTATLTDSFTYTLDDGNSATDTAELVITINAANEAPTATNNSNSIDEDATTAVTGNVIDDNDNSNGVDSDPN